MTDTAQRSGDVVNLLVEELNGYQPVDASLKQAFFETRTQTLDLETVASATLRRLVEAPYSRLVVLTGNAGHGKTHLCARLIKDLAGDGDFESASQLVIQCGNGDADVRKLADGRPLRIIKDLSEWPQEHATQMVRTALTADAVTVVCANEGRLRYCIERDTTGDLLLDGVQQALNQSIAAGGALMEQGSVAVLNLNFQGVAGGESESSLVVKVLDAWLDADEQWSVCSGCSEQKECPIWANRSALSGESEAGLRRREAVRRVLEIAEQCGTVITVRELLIVLSHMVTGGLGCNDVRTRVNTDPSDWRWEYMFHQLLFAPKLSEVATARSRTFRALRHLDPSHRAIRSVDDAVDLKEPGTLGTFHPSIASVDEPPPTNGRERRARAVSHQLLWRFARRRLLFEDHGLGGDEVPLERRLGFRSHVVFERVAEGGELARHERRDLKRSLEALQGVRGAQLGRLHLVDPAFAGQGAVAADRPDGAAQGLARIVSRDVATENLKASPARFPGWLENAAGKFESTPELVDWTARHVWLVVGSDQEDRELALGLAEFEYLLRVGRGLEARAAFSPTARKVLRWLGDLASKGSPESFVVFVDGSSITLSIDGDHVFDSNEE